MRLKIGVDGDRRVTEKVILEVKAVARRLGLEIENVEVVPKASIGERANKARKTRKPASSRKPRARA